MTEFPTILDRYLGGSDKAVPPPDWLLAPHLRHRALACRAPAAESSNDNDPPTPPFPPSASMRTRPAPFPGWCDDRGKPLTPLLGGAPWRGAGG
ncbi:hypothetical protein SAMN05444678_107183 [Sphingomonas sp. YR710]|uniref:hypothetical protein n=1 Tax=Sphingomonas sp. YR710 TaxID=1882773 RepID=UPI00088D5A47|nr:hypothetical protein [Sphingomonas sp. YR710]SDC97906.1 hypothetical protein SAMN05444678_107183 [Sphingomonas sp. YR710]